MATTSISIHPIPVANGLNSESVPLIEGKYRYQIDTECHDFYIDTSRELADDEIEELKQLFKERYDDPVLYPQAPKKEDNLRLEALLDSLGSQDLKECSTKYNRDGFRAWFPHFDIPFDDTRNTVEKYKDIIKGVVANKKTQSEHPSNFSNLAKYSNANKGLIYTNRSLLLIERLAALELFVNQAKVTSKFSALQLALLEKFLNYSVSQITEVPTESISYKDIEAALNVRQYNSAGEIKFSGPDKLLVQAIRLCFNIETSLLRNHSSIFDTYAFEFSELLKSLPHSAVEIYTGKGHLTHSLKTIKASLVGPQEYVPLPRTQPQIICSKKQAVETIDKNGEEAIYVSAYMDSRDIKYLDSEFGSVFLVVIGRVNQKSLFELVRTGTERKLISAAYRLKIDGFTERFINDQVTLYCLGFKDEKFKEVLTTIPKKFSLTEIDLQSSSESETTSSDFIYTPNGIM